MGTVEVVKSAQDKREYRYTQLENGLKVLLIHDADIAESLAQDAAGDAEASLGGRGPHSLAARVWGVWRPPRLGAQLWGCLEYP